MTLIDDFIAYEFDLHIGSVLRQALAEGRPRDFTFNVFNVHLDPPAELVVVLDELDPTRTETIALGDFVRMIDHCTGSRHGGEGRKTGEP